MESLFSLILVEKAEVFVICMVQIKLSIVLFEVRCCITRREVFTAKSRVGLTGWGKFEKDEKLLMKNFGLNFFNTLLLCSTFSYVCKFSRELCFNTPMSIFCKGFSIVYIEFFFRNFIFMHFLSFSISVVQVIDKYFEFSQKDSVQEGIIICKYPTLRQRKKLVALYCGTVKLDLKVCKNSVACSALRKIYILDSDISNIIKTISQRSNISVEGLDLCADRIQRVNIPGYCLYSGKTNGRITCILAIFYVVSIYLVAISQMFNSYCYIHQ